MGGMFSKPKTPTAPTVQVAAPPPPDRGDAAVQDAMDSERKRAALAQGRNSTILTATSDTQKGSAAKTLLGA